MMGRFGYSFQKHDPTRYARASIREKDMSHKHAREISHMIRGMRIDMARDYLQRVINLQSAVPMKRYKKQVGHKSDPGVMSGRYPQKSAKEFIKLMDNLEANADYMGMDTDRLTIVHVATQKGRQVKRFIPRAMGRASSKNNVMTHVEMVVMEV